MGIGGGFFAGGMAQGFGEQTQQQNLAKYRTDELKLQQQGQQNAQKRFEMTQADGHLKDLWSVLDDYVEHAKIVGTNPTEIAKHSAGLLQGIEKFEVSSGRSQPGMVSAKFATLLAKPSKTDTTKALTEAGMKPTPMRIQDETGKQSIQFADPRNMSVTPAEPVTGKLPAAFPQNGSGRGGFINASFNQVADDTGVTKLPGGFQMPEGFEVPKGYTFPAIMAAAERYRQTGQFPSGMSKGKQNTQFFQSVQNLAASIDQFEGSDPKEGPKKWQEFKAEQVGIQRFRSGPQGNTIRSLNVVVDHLDSLKGLGDALKNGDVRLFNEVANQWATQTGKPAPGNFATAKDIVGAELIKAIGVAGAGTADERANLGRRMSEASSPAQLLGVINDVAAPLLAGQLGGLRQQWRPATGLPESKFDEMLYPRTREFLKAKSEKDKPAASTGATQADPLGIR